MFISNNLSFRQIHECLVSAAKYPFLSVRTLVVSLVVILFECMIALNIAVREGSVSDLHVALIASYIMFTTGIMLWSLKTAEMHNKATWLLIIAGLMCGFLLSGNYKIAADFNSTINAEFWISFRQALTTIAYASLAITLLPYPIWVSFGLLMIEKVRTDKITRNVYLGKMIINTRLILILAFVSICSHVLLVITSYISPVILVFSPLLTIWLTVFIVLVIFQVTSGRTPGALIQEIARIKL